MERKSARPHASTRQTHDPQTQNLMRQRTSHRRGQGPAGCNTTTSKGESQTSSLRLSSTSLSRCLDIHYDAGTSAPYVFTRRHQSFDQGRCLGSRLYSNPRPQFILAHGPISIQRRFHAAIRRRRSHRGLVNGMATHAARAENRTAKILRHDATSVNGSSRHAQRMCFPATTLSVTRTVSYLALSRLRGQE